MTTPGFPDDLERLYDERDEEVRRRWRRSLPLGDALTDRWRRARRLGFGDGSSIYNTSLIFEPVVVGRDVWIGPFTILDGSGGGLTIGDGSQVSAGAHIYTHDTVLRTLSGGTADTVEGRVVIGERTYVGPNAVIVAGTTIGSQCVIGANSFVNSDVPDGAVVAGAPARRIGRVVTEGDSIRIVSED
ncbi:MAG: acyltransferase [Actinomycetota bacterium]|nr:acyltransferase [Actinomycetota bacterium]